MLFKSYLKSSKKHISFCVNKSQNHTNRFGKASHFVLAIVNVQPSDFSFIGLFFNGLIVYLQYRGIACSCPARKHTGKREAVPLFFNSLI